MIRESLELGNDEEGIFDYLYSVLILEVKTELSMMTACTLLVPLKTERQRKKKKRKSEVPVGVKFHLIGAWLKVMSERYFPNSHQK